MIGSLHLRRAGPFAGKQADLTPVGELGRIEQHGTQTPNQPFTFTGNPRGQVGRQIDRHIQSLCRSGAPQFIRQARQQSRQIDAALLERGFERFQTRELHHFIDQRQQVAALLADAADLVNRLVGQIGAQQ